MLHNSFLITKKNLKVNLNNRQKLILKQLFKHFKPGNTIYPGVLIRELNIKMKEAYEVLDLLEEQGYLQRIFEIYCPNESKSTGIIYDNLLELIGDDPIQDCPECGMPVDIQKNNILIYRLLHKVNIEYEE